MNESLLEEPELTYKHNLGRNIEEILYPFLQSLSMYCYTCLSLTLRKQINTQYLRNLAYNLANYLLLSFVIVTKPFFTSDT